MRIYILSDIHIDYPENYQWLMNISQYDFKNDFLILSGDISDNIEKITASFRILNKCFKEIFYTPGNHDLWVLRESCNGNSLQKFDLLKNLANDNNIRTEPFSYKDVSIVPLYGWYDFSFGNPCDQLLKIWNDFNYCNWPDDFDEKKITDSFINLNSKNLDIKNRIIISYSHFLPRIDLMPSFIPADKRFIYPALGSVLLEKQIRQLNSSIHVYGHSHVNVDVKIDNIRYVNNAFGYPSEYLISSKRLIYIYEIE